MKPAIRRAALPVAFLAIGLPAGIGAVVAMGDHDTTPEASSPFRSASGPQARFARHAEPRWERVTTFAGDASADRSFAIAPRAIQWKADWSCRAGRFQMAVGEASRDARLVTSDSCPDVGGQSSTGNGRGRLRVSASGPWRVVVSQQVDDALMEPPLAGMTAASLLARGHFHPIQNDGDGTVSLYRLAGGRLALRFTDFYTSASPGLRVWLSRARNVNSTLEARRAQHVDAGVLRSTLGSYNQLLPADLTADDFHTIVIWCPTVLIAFSAAPLTAL